ncbi:hypothetical protein [Vibrio viridaestus]|uniref:Uncharacterized protein n=1 Tax=Vibrio viridaestus TaxID=2487322 RepID=A0A3N9TKU1_9VIBR|nr:hypothetical protein [Vibrio viridaestus]RQW65008.1 hypothetical protein EES38_02965 [Vibrio viridaestus]
MFLYIVIGVLFGIYIVSGIISSIYEHKWAELRDLVLSVFFFPIVIIVFVVISVVVGIPFDSEIMRHLSFAYFFDEAHVLILLPAIAITAALSIPLYRLIERWFPDK